MAAPFGMKVVLRGDKELIRAMDQLKGGAQRRIARPAVTAGMKPIRLAARANAPVKEGLLKKAIGTILLKKSQTKVRGAVVGIVGPRHGFGKVIGGVFRDPALYGHLVEFGTVAHVIRATSKKALAFAGVIRQQVAHPGIKGARFLTRAFESKKGAALAVFTLKAKERLAIEVARARRKTLARA